MTLLMLLESRVQCTTIPENRRENNQLQSLIHFVIEANFIFHLPVEAEHTTTATCV